MIRKLRLRFIILSAASLALLLSVVAGGMNLLNYLDVEAEADGLLDAIAANRWTFPEDPPDELERRTSPELPYETRYFSVLLSPAGEVLESDTSSISSVGPMDAAELASEIYRSGKESGFSGSFRYKVFPEGAAYRVAFVDCSRKLAAFRSFRNFSVETSLAGLAAMVLVIVIFSGRIVAPVEEAYRRQRRFTADAGHELKTPLAVIGANADVLAMELGENESVSDIKSQVRRMAELTGDLSELARMDEKGKAGLSETDVSVALLEAAEPFRALAEGQGKALSVRVEPGMVFPASGRALARISQALLENAVKYSPEGAEISFEAERRKRGGWRLRVANPSSQPLDPEGVARVFERFYRMDSSRNSGIGGTGLGLPIAKAAAESMGGRMRASAEGKDVFAVESEFTGAAGRGGGKALLRGALPLARRQQGADRG